MMVKEMNQNHTNNPSHQNNPNPNQKQEDGQERRGDQNSCIVREQDRFMPIANVIRIMRKVLPNHAKISDDAKETVQECVSEFISFITSEANDRCQREQRKTITAEDVLWAMSKLGFDDYMDPLTLYLQRYREIEGDRGSIRGDPLMKRSVDLGTALNVATFAPAAFHMGHHQGLFGVGGAHLGGYFRDASGAGPSAHAAMASLDPFAPFINK
ncbi:nuclear transcription factor Y subunit B-1-like isoform X2 [Macadamia integrifolia]|nr:nuclear transcription factor Y subunit B-1-like isoform X2 [Macadamia integrifolia]XP_042520229.1 nuclear transcription factor Y subunit B-1-like isoform X2 [Macadamia integrifolia]